MAEAPITSPEQSQPSQLDVERRLLELERTGSPERRELLDVAANGLLDIVFLPDENEPVTRDFGGYSGTVPLRNIEVVEDRRNRAQRHIDEAREQGIAYETIKLAAKHEAIANGAKAEAALQEFRQAHPEGLKGLKAKLASLDPDSNEAQELRIELENFRWARGFVTRRDQFLELVK